MKTRMNSMNPMNSLGSQSHSQSRSETLLRTLIGVSILSCSMVALGSSSLFAAPPTTDPFGGTNAGGLFKTYFENILSTSCTGDEIVNGFSSNATTYLKGTCTSVGGILGSFFGGYINSDPITKAVVGFDATTGAPIYGAVTGTGWGLKGNGGTTAGSDFIGTTDNVDLVVKTNGNERMRVKGAGNIELNTNVDVKGTTTLSGNVGIGTNPGAYALDASGTLRAGYMISRNSAPTLYLQDTNNRSAMVHTNSNYLYFLRGDGNDSMTWSTYNGYWPLVLNLENNNATFGGNITAIANINQNLNIGSIARSYLPSGANWNYTALLNGQDTTSIGFHDSMASVSSIRYSNAGFVIGGDDGWGVRGVSLPGGIIGSLSIPGGIKGLPAPVANTDAATKKYVDDYIESDPIWRAQSGSYAKLNSPEFTGDPKSVTQAISDYSRNIATTAFVKNQGYVSTGMLAGMLNPNSLPKWNGGIFINSQIADNGTTVGIGTAPSGYKLDVNGFGLFREGLRVQNAGGAYTYITLGDDESPNGVKYVHANSNVIGFLNGGGGWSAYWDNSGNQVNMGSINATANINQNLNIGSTARNYLPSGGNWSYTALLNGQDTTSIGFHDSGASVSSIRYSNAGFVIGGDDGWGVKNVSIPGKLTAGGNLEITGETRISNAGASTRILHTGPSGGNTHIDTFGGAGGLYLNWFSGNGGTHIGNGAGGYGNLTVATPTAANHVATKAYVDAAVGGGKYSKTCNDWSAKGWTSKNDCIQDGRWHHVFTNPSWGAVPNTELTEAITNGATIKVGLPDMYIGAGDTCSSALILDGYAICLGGTRYSGTLADWKLRLNNTVEKNIGTAVYKSNGLLTCVSLMSDYVGGASKIDAGGCGPSINLKMDWYVQY